MPTVLASLLSSPRGVSYRARPGPSDVMLIGTVSPSPFFGVSRTCTSTQLACLRVVGHCKLLGHSLLLFLLPLLLLLLHVTAFSFGSEAYAWLLPGSGAGAHSSGSLRAQPGEEVVYTELRQWSQFSVPLDSGRFSLRSFRCRKPHLIGLATRLACLSSKSKPWRIRRFSEPTRSESGAAARQLKGRPRKITGKNHDWDGGS